MMHTNAFNIILNDRQCRLSLGPNARIELEISSHTSNLKFKTSIDLS